MARRIKGHRLAQGEASLVERLMEDLGVTQKVIAKKMRVTPSHLSAILVSKRCISPVQAGSLYGALGYDPSVSFLQRYQRSASPEDQHWLALYDLGASGLRASYQQQDVFGRAAVLQGLSELREYAEQGNRGEEKIGRRRK